jgi:hypothetical protein
MMVSLPRKGGENPFPPKQAKIKNPQEVSKRTATKLHPVF